MALSLGNFVGFETGGLEEAIGIGGTPSVVETNVRTGDYCLLLDAAADEYDVVKDISAVPVGTTYPLYGFAFRTDDATPAANRKILELRTGSPTVELTLTLLTTGVLRATVAGNGVDYDGSTALSDATWHFIEVAMHVDDVSGYVYVWLDGNLEISRIGIDARADAADPNVLTCRYFGATEAFRLDDVYTAASTVPATERLGDAEVFRYQANTNSATPDAGDNLDVGVWQNLGKTPANVDEAKYEGTPLSGDIYTDDTQVGKHYRHGPHGDEANIDGIIKNGKWIHILKRGNGGGTTHYSRYGNDNDPVANRVVNLTISYVTYLLQTTSANYVPLVTEHFSLGMRVVGNRDLFCQEMWAMLLHVPPLADLDPDEIMAAAGIAGGSLGAMQPYIEPDEIVSY